MGSRLMSSREVRARFGGISAWTLWDWRRKGRIPAPLPGFNSTHPMWLESDIDAAIEALRR